MLPLTDCRLIQQIVDGLLVVVAAHRTPRQLLSEALAEVDAKKVLGVVFNRADTWRKRYYYSSDPAPADPEGWGTRIRASLGRSRAGGRPRPRG
jgi:Mrp family chromosome partitioning ATPase